MANSLFPFIILATIRTGFLEPIRRYEYVVPGQGVVVEQKDTVNCSVVFIANDTLAIYGSIANESEYFSTASLSFVFEGNGTSGKVLGTLLSLDSTGSPIITNSTVVTISSDLLSNGGFLVRLYSDISQMRKYSFRWFADLQKTYEISMSGLEGVTILNSLYSETNDFLYLDNLVFNLSEYPALEWLPLAMVNALPSVFLNFPPQAMFTCPQSIPGKVNTFISSDGITHLSFKWWNTTYDKEIFINNDHFYKHTNNYGNLSADQRMTAPFVPLAFPSAVLFNGVGQYTISYFADDSYKSYTMLNPVQQVVSLFGNKFHITYEGSFGLMPPPGTIEINVLSQLPCNFLTTGPNYTCTQEFYLTTINDAIEDCARLNGSLPIFHEYLDISILQKSADTSFLKPIKDNSNFKVWLGFKDGKWMDGSNFTAEALNYPASNNSSSLVYDRQTKQVMEWTGVAGMICAYQTNSDGLCSNFGHVDYQYFAHYPMCLLVSSWESFDYGKTTCQSKLTSKPGLPEPQSYRENELIYNFAITTKKSVFLSDYVDLGLDEKPSHAFLNFQGGRQQNCTVWPDSKQPMNYTNFIKNPLTNDCSNKAMCLAMRLEMPNAGKWEFISCTINGVGVCTVKPK